MMLRPSDLDQFFQLFEEEGYFILPQFFEKAEIVDLERSHYEYGSGSNRFGLGMNLPRIIPPGIRGDINVSEGGEYMRSGRALADLGGSLRGFPGNIQ